MKVSDIQNMHPNNIPPFLLGAMLNKIETKILFEEDIPKKYFFVFSDYRIHKKLNDYIIQSGFQQFINNVQYIGSCQDLQQYLELSKYYTRNIYNMNSLYIVDWEVNPLDKCIGFFIENDLEFDKKDFFKMLINKLISCSWLNSNNNSIYFKNMFLKGFIEPRCSIDTELDFISIDIFYDDQTIIWFKNFFEQNFNTFANLNFRYYQQNSSGKNPQFRLPLNLYVKNVGIDNPYKFARYKLL